MASVTDGVAQHVVVEGHEHGVDPLFWIRPDSWSACTVYDTTVSDDVKQRVASECGSRL